MNRISFYHGIKTVIGFTRYTHSDLQRVSLYNCPGQIWVNSPMYLTLQSTRRHTRELRLTAVKYPTNQVTRADEGHYKCIATLTGVTRYTIGGQSLSRTSLPIQLRVFDQAPIADWGPVIQDEFIAVFPALPLAGHDVRLECFAYGT
ncbi:protein roadkill [Elysia marginata]|uniref:Protein roadkill n=1 Tax=Elysia marginata TaxID=1093978 RepID=A0AAV4IRP6_9GAST|nr:protein roadkill [Elysia marginata]